MYCKRDTLQDYIATLQQFKCRSDIPEKFNAKVTPYR